MAVEKREDLGTRLGGGMAAIFTLIRQTWRTLREVTCLSGSVRLRISAEILVLGPTCLQGFEYTL